MRSSRATGDAVHRPGAAERHQGAQARVVAALDRDDADAAHDVGVRDAQDAGRRRHQRRCRAARRCGSRSALRAASGSSCRLPPSRVSPSEPAEHEIGVGDGRPRAAAAVAGRARHGFGARRPDAQRAAVVDPGDRAAARADGVDVDDRQGGSGSGRSWQLRVVSGRPLRIRLMSVLVPPMSMVMMLPAPTRPAKCAPATTPPAGPDRTVCTGLRARGLQRHQPAGGLHHHDRLVAPDAEAGLAVAQPRPKRAEVAGHDRRQEGVEHRRAGPLELAELARGCRSRCETATPGSCCSSTALASRSCAGLA